MEDKPLKDSTNQAKPINGMGITSLMMGSEASMFGDSKALKEFRMEFATKLSRRCFFLYPTHVENNRELTSNELQQMLLEQDAKPDTKMRKMNKLSKTLVDYRRANENDNGSPRLLELIGDARDVFLHYKAYCQERAKIKTNGVDITTFDTIISLEMSNRDWKTLKLAGVFAVFRLSNEISVQDLREAISFAESTNGYLKKFLTKADELPHEKLALYVREFGCMPKLGLMKKWKWIDRNHEVSDLCESANMLVEDIGSFSVSHGVYIFKAKEIQKIGFSLASTDLNDATKQQLIKKLQARVSSISTPEGKVHELEKLKLNLNTENNELIKAIEKDIKKEIKGEMSKATVTQGWEHHVEDFESLVDIVSRNGAISAFKYTDGVRLRNNCLGKTNLLILDVDTSDETMQEVSDNLSEYNHIIATSSDNKNPYKFRILIKLDKIISITSNDYKNLLKAFVEEHGIEVDILSREQLYFTYQNAKVVSNFDGEDLNIDDLNIKVSKRLADIKYNQPSDESELWERRRDIFARWFGIRKTEQNKQVRTYALAIYAKQLGASRETTVNLITEFAELRRTREGYLEELIIKVNEWFKENYNE